MPFAAQAQVGAPVINITFGDSLPDPGPPLPAQNTAFVFSPDSCPPPGKYTVTNSLYHCAATRMGRSIDNTPNSRNGYMMLVDDTISKRSKILFIDTLYQTLCPGSVYRFSAYFLNVAIPGYCSSPSIHFPQFTLKIETTTGQVLASANTGPIPYGYNTSRTPQFIPFGVNFTMGTGINGLVVKIMDDSSGYSPCGYEFALDDIQFMTVGPTAEIAFDDDVFGGYELVKEVCFQDSVTLGLKGRIDAPGFVQQAVQWQQSTDGGLNWADIAGATALTLSRTFTVADTFLFRLRASEASRIGNPNCSVVSNTRKVAVDGIPTNYTISTNSPVCAGSALLFNLTGPAAVIWTGPNGFYDDVGYASIFHTVLSDSGTYYAKIISTGGCFKMDSLQVRILGSVDPSISPPDSLCKGSTVQLHASGGVHYRWTPPAGLSNPLIPNPEATPEVTTTYSVRIQNDVGCRDSLSVKITVLNEVPVKASIEGSDYICRPSDSASFKDVSSGTIRDWLWDFGNGVTSTLQNPPVQYYAIGSGNFNYTVRLIVADSSGCADSTFHLLTVEDNCYIAVPNAFTPNGDGLNDFLYPLNAYKAKDLVFRVFNRYGELLFETTDWTKKWDGNKGGQPMPPDVYVWTLNYRDQTGRMISLKGYTLLIR